MGLIETGFTLCQTNPGFHVSAEQVFCKHCGKRRNNYCLLSAISSFPTVFPACLENFMPYLSNLKLSYANSFSLEESKICRLQKGKSAYNYTILFENIPKFFARAPKYLLVHT